jgi:ABC-2 type transport system permease protein
MAVYKRTYKGYAGTLTPQWSRFMILPRYSYARLFQSKFLLMFLAACVIYPVGAAGFIYIAHNMSFLKALNVGAGNLLDVNETFFVFFCNFQGAMAYLLTAVVGPSLVSPDVTNNAMPLYLCRPFTRTEYVLGRMTVLLYLLAWITWIPGLILFGIQADMAGWDWTKNHLWIGWGVFAGLFVWSVVLSLIALAISAWVRWKIAAGGLILGVFFVGGGFGAAINAVMRTKNGSLIDIVQMMKVAWGQLFRYDTGIGISTAQAWMVLAAVSAISLWLLSRKVRAFEVVK